MGDKIEDYSKIYLELLNSYTEKNDKSVNKIDALTKDISNIDTVLKYNIIEIIKNIIEYNKSLLNENSKSKTISIKNTEEFKNDFLEKVEDLNTNTKDNNFNGIKYLKFDRTLSSENNNISSIDSNVEKNPEFDIIKERLSEINNKNAIFEYDIIYISGDGNCLFNALIQTVKEYGISGKITDNSLNIITDQMVLREVLVDHFIENSNNKFDNLIGLINNGENNNGINEWSNNMKINGTWGDENIICAFSDRYNINVVVLDTKIESDIPGCNMASDKENAEKLYLGRISINDTDRNNHYIGTSRKPKNP